MIVGLDEFPSLWLGYSGLRLDVVGDLEQEDQVGCLEMRGCVGTLC